MAKKKVVATHAMLSEINDQKVRQKKGPVLKFNGEPAVLRVSQGVTLNMGNYQSLRLGVDLALPCDPTKVEQAFVTAEKFVSSHLQKLIAKNSENNNNEAAEPLEDFNL